MKFLAYPLLLCTLFLLFFSCSKDDDNDDPSLYPLSGLVSDESNRSPIMGAILKLSSLEDISIKTDAKGYYSFGDLPTGTYKLSISKPNYVSKEVEVNLNSTPSSQKVNINLVKDKVYPLYGYITDPETKGGIENVEVKITSSTAEFVTRTGQKGNYSFVNIPIGNYKMTVSKYNYEIKQFDIVLDESSESQRRDAELIKNNKSIIGVSNYVSINDGAAYLFEAAEDLAVFFWAVFPTDKLPPYEEQIVDFLLTDTEPYEHVDYLYYSTNLLPNNNYTLVAVGINENNEVGGLFKLEFKTKSNIDQPIAKIDVESFSSSRITLSTSMNEFCESYSFIRLGVNSEDYILPDVLLAAYCYFNNNNNKYSKELESATWSMLDSDPNYGAIITLGYDGQSVNSGLVDKVFFSRSAGSIIETPAIADLKSLSDEIQYGYKNLDFFNNLQIDIIK